MAQQLEVALVTMTVPLPAQHMRVRDKSMHNLGMGMTHEMRSVIHGVSGVMAVLGPHTQ